MVDGELLRYRYLNDLEAERLYRDNPRMKADPEEYCPTCATAKTFYWQGKMQPCDCEMQLQLHKHYQRSGIGMEYQLLDWDDFEGDPQVKEWMDNYLENHANFVNRGQGLILHGDFGVGKTMATTLLLKDLVKLGHRCYSTTFSHMVEMFTAGWRDPDEQKHFQSKIIGSDVLLLDDLGREMRSKTKLSEATFDDVLRRRVQNARATFITTNMNLAELGRGYGGAILSMLWGSSLTHEMVGTDYRATHSVRRSEELSKGIVRPIT